MFVRCLILCLLVLAGNATDTAEPRGCNANPVGYRYVANYDEGRYQVLTLGLLRGQIWLDSLNTFVYGVPYDSRLPWAGAREQMWEDSSDAADHIHDSGFDTTYFARRHPEQPRCYEILDSTLTEAVWPADTNAFMFVTNDRRQTCLIAAILSPQPHQDTLFCTDAHNSENWLWDGATGGMIRSGSLRDSLLIAEDWWYDHPEKNAVRVVVVKLNASGRWEPVLDAEQAPMLQSPDDYRMLPIITDTTSDPIVGDSPLDSLAIYMDRSGLTARLRHQHTIIQLQPSGEWDTLRIIEQAVDVHPIMDFSRFFILLDTLSPAGEPVAQNVLFYDVASDSLWTVEGLHFPVFEAATRSADSPIFFSTYGDGRRNLWLLEPGQQPQRLTDFEPPWRLQYFQIFEQDSIRVEYKTDTTRSFRMMTLKR